MSCANLQPECFQSFSLENTRFEKAKKEPKKDSALRRFGRDLTELAAQGAARVNAETLKAEMLKWESRKHWGSLAAESRTLATAWQRW